MTVKQIDGGRIRSEKEAAAAAGNMKCPQCGHNLRTKWATESDTGVVWRTTSRHCGTDFDVVFSPGPGWDQRPPDEDPRFGATDDPSTVLPEAVFRMFFDQGIEGVRDLEPPPGDDADETTHQIWDSGARAYAHRALGGLEELRKFARAEGRAEDPMLAKVEPYLRALFASPRAAYVPGEPR